MYRYSFDEIYSKKTFKWSTLAQRSYFYFLWYISLTTENLNCNGIASKKLQKVSVILNELRYLPEAFFLRYQNIVQIERHFDIMKQAQFSLFKISSKKEKIEWNQTCSE